MEPNDTRHRTKDLFAVLRNKEMELCRVRQEIESIRLVILLLVEDMEETETLRLPPLRNPMLWHGRLPNLFGLPRIPPRAGEEVGSREGCLTCPNFHADYTHDVPNTSTGMGSVTGGYRGFVQTIR